MSSFDIDRALSTLLTLTQIPTAAGREWRVVEFIRAWVAARPDLEMRADGAGNLTVLAREGWGTGGAPVLITAHLDHPAFVVERVVAPSVLELAFRGGVRDAYFEAARVVVHAGGRDGFAPAAVGATLTGAQPPNAAGFNRYLAEVDADAAEGVEELIRPGDVATWELPPAEIDAGGVVHTNACDDLAAAASALCALDALRARRAAGEKTEDVRLLFTRSEEIGFTGALAACKLGTIPAGSRVIALENSRSFADSPLGAGPIVRVGDRMSIFDPALTAACAKRAEELAGATAEPAGSGSMPKFAWQRKLMAGGACEATAFCAYGHQATCICLPLGNYHNMGDLKAVEEGTWDKAKNGPPRVAREFIHRDDYLNLVALLVGIGLRLPSGPVFMERLEGLYAKHAAVLEER
jgi:endoglucanase